MRIRRSQFFLVPVLLLLDCIFIGFSFKAAYLIRFYSFFTNIFPVTKGIPDWRVYQYALYLIIPLWLFIFIQNGFYRVPFVRNTDEFLRVVRSATLGIFFLVMTTFFYRSISYSRMTFFLFWVLSIGALFLYRVALKPFARYFLNFLSGRESILVVGKENKKLKAALKQHPYYHVYFYPAFVENEIEKIKTILEEKNIKQVIFVNNSWEEQNLLNLYDWCEANNIDLKFLPDLVQLCKGEVNIDSTIGIPIFHLRPVSLNGFNFYFKRMIENAALLVI
jgi:FlaA1/EpsC-like NDP-sugar epimerase